MENKKNDQETADAFAKSWNNLPLGSIYSQEQFEEWFEPISKNDVEAKSVLELGCGNGSLMMRLATWEPATLVGVDMGDSVATAKKNMSLLPYKNWRIVKDDLTKYRGSGFDFVYCIGVLHHLKNPEQGFASIIRNTKKGGIFHCWVYAREGNSLIIYFVDPLRRVVNRLPWWLIKYLFATPLIFPYYIYAKILRRYRKIKILQKLPLYKYSLWIADREFAFFRHVAFDQLVTPQTAYIDKKTVEKWLNTHTSIDPNSIYIIKRNGISWKFGGKIKE